MEKISDRILIMIKNEGITIRSFEQKIGCSNGVISRCIQKGTDIGSNWLSIIIEIYPKYNAEWFLTGKGDMLKGNASSEQMPGICEKCILKDELIDGLYNQIDTLRKINIQGSAK
jgi:hypothetical protein